MKPVASGSAQNIKKMRKREREREEEESKSYLGSDGSPAPIFSIHRARKISKTRRKEEEEKRRARLIVDCFGGGVYASK